MKHFGVLQVVPPGIHFISYNLFIISYFLLENQQIQPTKSLYNGNS